MLLGSIFSLLPQSTVVHLCTSQGFNSFSPIFPKLFFAAKFRERSQGMDGCHASGKIQIFPVLLTWHPFSIIMFIWLLCNQQLNISIAICISDFLNSRLRFFPPKKLSLFLFHCRAIKGKVYRCNKRSWEVAV